MLLFAVQLIHKGCATVGYRNRDAIQAAYRKPCQACSQRQTEKALFLFRGSEFMLETWSLFVLSICIFHRQ